MNSVWSASYCLSFWETTAKLCWKADESSYIDDWAPQDHSIQHFLSFSAMTCYSWSYISPCILFENVLNLVWFILIPTNLRFFILFLNWVAERPPKNSMLSNQSWFIGHNIITQVAKQELQNMAEGRCGRKTFILMEKCWRDWLTTVV